MPDAAVDAAGSATAGAMSGTARALNITAGLFVAAMMVLTVGDVTLRAALNISVRGTLEIVELLLACSFFIALPAAFIRDENLVVDMVDTYRPNWVPFVKRVSLLISAVALAVIAWQGWIVAKDAHEFGDVTSDLSLPRIIYWVPVLFGIVASAIACVVLLVTPQNPDHP